MLENNRDANDEDRRASPTGSGTNARPRILVAEDDDEMRRLLARVLRGDGYAVVECRDGADLFEHLEAFVGRRSDIDFDGIVSDIVMPGPTGLEILETLHHHTGFPPVILITAFGDRETHARAEKAGAAAVLDKPFGIDQLLAKVRETMPPPPQGSRETDGSKRTVGRYP